MALLQDSQPDLCLLAKSGGCSVYQLRNESGEGTMTVYEVFPGATILYNDFHMAYCDSSLRPGRISSASTIAGRAGWNTLWATMRSPMWRQVT